MNKTGIARCIQLAGLTYQLFQIQANEGASVLLFDQLEIAAKLTQITSCHLKEDKVTLDRVVIDIIKKAKWSWLERL